MREPITVSGYIEALRLSPALGRRVSACRFTPPQAASYRSLPRLCEPTLRMLDDLGLTRLYDHQQQALESIRKGHHTAVCTPTASGKSLIYNLAVFDAFFHEPRVRALYLFPLKALAQDQLTLLAHWREVAGNPAPAAAIYDGDTSAYQRARLRRHPPNIVLSNPEMLHAALLPYHDRWGDFFKHLTFVVIDEMHTYRGLGGAHMAQVLRRLQRICDYYGAQPCYIFTSATVANPDRLASQLSGLEVHTIQDSGAPQGGRHRVLIDPEQSPATTAILLMKAALARRLRTIVYTQSRKMAELISHWAKTQSGALAGRISVYRAGLLPRERREIEQDLKEGRLLAVVSTSALELGIDVGTLDICILVGYPGSMISTLQRGGRVGRKGQESALIMIASEDALDHYFIRHPEAFFNGRPENVVINPYNPVVLKAHLVCAAAEILLDSREAWLNHPSVHSTLVALEAEGTLLRTADGNGLAALRRYPHRDVALRGGGERYLIVESDLGRPIGEMDAFRLYRETYPGAIYLHHGVTYLIEEIKTDSRSVQARRVEVDYHTRVRSGSTVRIVKTDGQKGVGATRVFCGTIKVTEQVEGYDRIRTSSGEVIGQIPLMLPPMLFESDALWFDVPAGVLSDLSNHKCDPLGALHAAEHAAIAIMPLLVLADRNDVGGVSTLFHPQTGGAVIFIYDGIPGGAGLSRQAYVEIIELLSQAEQSIAQCNCEHGCPACVHSPKCGSGNHPIDKSGAQRLLQKLRRQNSQSPPYTTEQPTIGDISPGAPTPASGIYQYGVLDLETQLSALEVGGWHLAHRMKVSCAVIYDSRVDDFVTYREDQIVALIDHLRQFDLVVGFNIRRFDYHVLSGYSDFDFDRLPTLDLLEFVRNRLGFRLSLDHLARVTLGISKCGSGLDALHWWRQGHIRELTDYCRKDVAITRDLFEYAHCNGYLLYQDRCGRTLRILCDPQFFSQCAASADRTSSRPHIPAGA
jgi:DEAD/DEAH box helicase domain-containing protein